jgi:putative hemolysin
LLVRRRQLHAWTRKEFSLEEIKHFLTHETLLFQYSPETLKMINEIIDISQKDIKTIMTPRPRIVALDENADLAELRRVIAEKRISKIPIYRGSLDNITGLVHPQSFLTALLREEPAAVRLHQIAAKPLFVSEYSSLHFILDQFKRQRISLAIILNEYGATIGLITLSDILREILGEIDIAGREIQKLRPGVYQVKGHLAVAEVNDQLEIDLPERKDYSTLSGLFIYHYGRFPNERAHLLFGANQLVVRRMGKRKIDELLLLTHESHHR